MKANREYSTTSNFDALRVLFTTPKGDKAARLTNEEFDEHLGYLDEIDNLEESIFFTFDTPDNIVPLMPPEYLDRLPKDFLATWDKLTVDLPYNQRQRIFHNMQGIKGDGYGVSFVFIEHLNIDFFIENISDEMTERLFNDKEDLERLIAKCEKFGQTDATTYHRLLIMR